MSQAVPQSILDALTDVRMPRRMSRHAPQRYHRAFGMRFPVHQAQALVVGSGAAGLRAAIELKRRQVDVVVATLSLFGGTSACSGSDKQTLHTALTSRRGDNFLELANALSAGGAMDADTAYVEAVGSVDAVSGLKYLGLALPEDRFGAMLRYQTDHDETGRATSCGPRTSRLMVKVLAEEAARLGIRCVDRCVPLRLLIAQRPDGPVISGLLAAKSDGRSAENPYGLVIFDSPAVVLATGGPGELYRDSVYPRNCFGSLGLALEAGIELVNLTESQFGVGTPRDGFPWNLSGTYMQAIPYVYSVDARGREHNFLAEYYRTTQELASNVFRKGYQWPFQARRMLDFGSSLVDLAVLREQRAGRRMYVDFNRNPLPVPGDLPFSTDRLDPDVQAYLSNNNALEDSPVERLRRMNPLSIELYKHHKRDLTKDPLEFRVNNQHMNGGVAVSIWGESSLSGCYAVGEVAGTHGVTRPGGSALNSGQVFAMRCARHIQAHLASRALESDEDNYREQIQPCLALIRHDLDNAEGLSVDAVRREVQARMSDKAGFICHAEDVGQALRDAESLNAAIRQRGLRIAGDGQLAKAVLWRQLALTSEAVLRALRHYVVNGGGSRGTRALCSPAGSEVPQTRTGPLEEFRFVPERQSDRHRQIRVRYASGRFEVTEAPLRELGSLEGIYFEKTWPQFLTGQIYRE
jgi:succinate dehydrogenase/fumarate reductase flavoprotein subunit